MSVSAYALAPCIAKASAITVLFNMIGDNIKVTFNYDQWILCRQDISNHATVKSSYGDNIAYNYINHNWDYLIVYIDVLGRLTELLFNE